MSTLFLPEPASVIHVWGRELLLISSRKKQIFSATASNSMPIVHAWRMPVVSGHFKDAIAKPESFSLLYLNPPYDSEIGSAGNNRMDLVSSRETGVLEVGEMVAAIDYNGPWV
jgi:hypothetical protein